MSMGCNKGLNALISESELTSTPPEKPLSPLVRYPAVAQLLVMRGDPVACQMA